MTPRDSPRPALAFALLLIVSACRTVPVGPAVDWQSEKAARQALSHWEMSGRAAVATPTEGFNAALHWQQSGDTSEARLQGAFGVGGVRVVAKGGLLEVETSNGERIESAEAGPALEKAIGVELPVNELRYWLLGVPAPSSPAEEELDAQRRLTRLSQQGWTITFDRFARVDGSWLPRRMRLERGPVRVRVIADRWKF